MATTEGTTGTTSLVLGGSTFVGRTLVAHLLGRGDRVSVLNRGRSAAPDGVSTLIADRTDPAAVRAAIGGRDWDEVYDVSGFVKTTTAEAFSDLVSFLNGRTGAYVYVSSIMAYQPSGTLPWPETQPLRAEAPTRYGGFKVHAERTLLTAHAERGFPAAIARPAAIYGPHNNIYGMEAAMFLRLRDGLPILLPHGGDVATSYGHVDDLCTALTTMAANPAASGEAFNITGEAVSSREYVSVLAELAGAEPDIRLLPDDVVDRLSGPAFCHLFHRRHHGTLDTTKATTTLGLTPRYDFRTGHAQTHEWLRTELLPGVTNAMSDPLWGAGFDLRYEAEVAGRAAA